MPQTFFDVRIVEGKLKGLKSNLTPLRRDEADRMAERENREGYFKVEVVPTSDLLWESVYGDKAA